MLKGALNSLADAIDRLNPNGVTNRNSGNAKQDPSEVIVPWSKEAQDSLSLFQPIKIQGDRWDRVYPYRFVVVEAKGDGTYAVYGGENPEVSYQKASQYSMVFNKVSSSWIFNLPITPRDLNISTQYSISTSATLRGIIEEHSGTRFKMIAMNGSFGVLPFKNKKLSSPEAPAQNSIQTLFAGTIQAVNSLSNSLTAVSNALRGNTQTPSVTAGVATTQGGFEGTGYAQALLLDQFLERYADLKKSGNNPQLRLAFDIPKQNQTFLVTPLVFSYFQSAESPNEYKFNCQLKAYKRINLNSKQKDSTTPIAQNTSPSGLARILNSIITARVAASASLNLIKAVRSDFQTPFEALRDLSLFVKQLSGVGVTASELPRDIINDASSYIADSISNLEQTGSNISKIVNNFSSLGGLVEAGFRSVPSQQLNNSSSAMSKLTQTPEGFIQLLDEISLEDLNLPDSFLEKIQDEIDSISLLTTDDINQRKKILEETAFQISQALGTGDSFYSKVYGKAAPQERLQPITLDEYQLLTAMYDAIQQISILSSTEDVQANTQNAYEFVKSEADAAGITFEDSNSKIRVPVPFSLTMEQIAQRYLGDYERWIEITTLNALKSPYIDENGFFYNLLSNGSGRQFNINTKENLFVGQRIYLSSVSQPRQLRRILNIEKINDTNYLITVDGLDNLNIFTTNDLAKMQAYLPGTVNSQDQIWVPSTLPVAEDLAIRPIPATQDDELTGLSKVDFLLGENNDIVLDQFGDFKLSYGITNLFQSLRVKLITEKGSRLTDPDFGLGLQPGISNADIDVTSIFRDLNDLVSADDRFEGIENLQVELKGPILEIAFLARMAGGLGVFPISFKTTI